MTVYLLRRLTNRALGECFWENKIQVERAGASSSPSLANLFGSSLRFAAKSLPTGTDFVQIV